MPIPTAEEIETTREVLALVSYTDASARIEQLLAVQWAAQQEDNDLWTSNRNTIDDVKRVGEIEFFDMADGGILSKIRNRSRLRFGLPALSAAAADAEAQSAGRNLTSTLRWF